MTGTKANAQGGTFSECHCSNLEKMEDREEMMNMTEMVFLTYCMISAE